ncbi:hypothetical protein N7465_004221 [Penicillium sp. CMV-2018d]|nr:hypothetical protein N7465_004221 [Penicillium sp. CMV-2018d]
MPEDFAFPFVSAFDILPTNTSDVMLHSDRAALSLEDHMGFYLEDPIASTPGQMKHGGTMSTPERLLDEPISQRISSTPIGVQSPQAELSFPGFPQFSLDDTDLLISDDYCHVPEVSEHDYDALSRLYYKSVPAFSSETNGNFPPREIMNVFVQLYFEYFHPGFHLLHQGTFHHRQRSSCLLLAVAAIGAQYSRVSSRGQCSLALLEILRRALLDNKADPYAETDTEYLYWNLFDLVPLISLSELHAWLPCDDELWQSPNVSEQLNLMQTDPFPPHSPSVLDVLGAQITSKELTWTLGSSASLFTMISACAKDRSFFQLMKAATTDVSANESDAGIAAICAAQSHRTKMLANQALSNVAGKLHKYRLGPDETSSSLGVFSAMKKIYSVSRILEHVPYRLLYTSAGWMASKKDTEASLEDLKKRLRSNPEMSRRTLIYAAQLFRRVRNQRWLEACDPLYVLFATLYIWYFGRIFESSTEPDSAMGPALKIDDESLNETVWMQWVESGDMRRPHIAGIGFLDGKHNGHRVLKEAIRILSNGQGWQHFSLAIAGSLQRILSGLVPSFEDA